MKPLTLMLAGVLLTGVAGASLAAETDLSGLHDFDFLVGEWRVHSERLKERLAGNQEWFEFEGTLRSWPTMEGRGNVDDTVFRMPEGVYRGVAPRAYDSSNGTWSIWWIDGRNASNDLAPPVRGRFVDGVGTFHGDDTLREMPIKVRYIWSEITPHSARWEQAFSGDGGKTWETNWVQRLERVPVAESP